MPKFDRSKFFSGVRAFLKSHGMTLTQKRTDALDSLLDGFEGEVGRRWTIPQVAYALATIFHETAHTFEPIGEYGSKSYFNKYNAGTSIGRRLGNTEEGDGYRYRGRGYVQITGRANYKKFEIDDDPDAALTPKIAFRVLSQGMHYGMFTGKKLSDYISDTGKDYKNARKIINGLDKAGLLANYANQFEDILRESKTNSAAASITNPLQHTESHIEAGESNSAEQPSSNGTVKAEITPEGGVKVETTEGTPAPKERIAVVKATPQNWMSGVTTKITGIVTGNALFQWLWSQLDKIQELSVPNTVWIVVSVTIAAGSLLWIVYEIVDTWRANRNQERIDDLLVKENSTAANLVQLIPADELELYRARGFKIITRGEKA